MEAEIDFTDEESKRVLEIAKDNLFETVESIRTGCFGAEGKNCRMCYFDRICIK